MSEKKIKFIFTGGGSGGHVSPALAVAAELKKTLPEAEITYIGVKNKAEAQMVPKAGIPLKFVESTPLPQGKSPLSLLKFAATMFLGLSKAAVLLLKTRPAAVFATGGFVSAPTVFAAWFLRRVTFGLFKTKIMIHESNTDLGKMNKAAAKAADKVAVSFSETMDHLPKNKGFFSGYPVRSSIVPEERAAARKELGIPEDAFVIFAFGGSQGSRTINRVLANSAKKLLADPNTYIIHGAGKPFGKVYEYHGFNDVSEILEKQNLGEAEKRYILRDFIDNMGLYYAASDLLVIRAGAGSVVDVCRLGKPSLIIPISNIANDHQIGNARFIERAGAAVVIYEKTDPLNGINIAFADTDEFCGTVSKLRGDKAKLAGMAEAAKKIFPGSPAETIVKNLLYLCGLGEKPAEINVQNGVKDRVLGHDSNGLEKFLLKTKTGAEKKLDDEEKKLVKNKIDILFSSNNPVIKARACRSAGIAGYIEIIPLVEKYAADKKSAPFLSRDAFVALKQLIPDSGAGRREELFKTILSGLENSYYETRFKAEMCIPPFAEHFKKISDTEREKFMELLFKNISDRCFEVRMEAVLAAAHISTDAGTLLKHFSKLYFDSVWKVRMALLQAFEILIKRGVLDKKTAVAEISRILITSNGYTTEYELKKEYNSLMELISQEKKL